MTYDEINVGDSAFTQKTISESDVYGFAGIVGDFNPAHVDERYAQGTKFGRRIVHGILTSGLLSAVMAMKLPGEGTIYLSQELKFVAPVFIGDTIKATVTVSEKLEKGRVVLDCICTNQEDQPVITGTAVVMPRRS